MIFEWKGGSSEGQARNDEGCLSHVLKKGDDGYMADLWEYEGKVIIDLSALVDGEVVTGREEIMKNDLEKSHYESAEAWADLKLARFLEAKSDWRRP